MLDLVRTGLHRVITSETGDRFLPVRLPKDLARRFNAMLGEPLCSKTELERRKSGAARLEELKKQGNRKSTQGVERPTAPVMIYFEKDRNERFLHRMKELLDSKSITYTLLDVTADVGTKDFVLREAKCKEDELPVVFVGGNAVGGYNELVDFDVSGRLTKALHGN
jgi:glutaredoxin